MRLSRSPGVHLEVVLERGLETQELKPSSCESDVPGIRGSLKYADLMFSSLHSEARCKSDQGLSLHSSLPIVLKTEAQIQSPVLAGGCPCFFT